MTTPSLFTQNTYFYILETIKKVKKCIILILSLLNVLLLTFCNDIEERMDKKFNLHGLQRDLGFMDEMDLLSENQLLIFRAFINDKIMNDSLRWLEQHTYRQLWGYAASYTPADDALSEKIKADKMQQIISIKMDGAYTDSLFFSFTCSNFTGRPVRSILAEVILLNEYNSEFGRLKLKQIDSIPSGKSVQIKSDNSLLFTYKETKNATYKPVVKRILFCDGEEMVNAIDQ